MSFVPHNTVGASVRVDTRLGKVLVLRGFKNRFLEPAEAVYGWDDVISFITYMATFIEGHPWLKGDKNLVNKLIYLFSNSVQDKYSGPDIRFGDEYRLLNRWVSVIVHLLVKKSFGFQSSLYFGRTKYGERSSQGRAVDNSSSQVTSTTLYTDVMKEIMGSSGAPNIFSMMGLASKSLQPKKVWYEKYIDTIPFQCLCRALREYTDRMADNKPLLEIDVRARFMIIWRCIATGINFNHNGEALYGERRNRLYRMHMYNNFFKLLNEEVADLIVYEYANMFENETCYEFIASLIFYGRIDLAARYIKKNVLPSTRINEIKSEFYHATHLFGPIPDWFIPTYESILPSGAQSPYNSLYHMIKEGEFTTWSIPMILSAIDKGYVTKPLSIHSLSNVVVDPFFYRLSDEDKKKIYDHTDKDPMWKVLLFAEGELTVNINNSFLIQLFVLNGYDFSGVIDMMTLEEYEDRNSMSIELEDGIYGSIDDEDTLNLVVDQANGVFSLDTHACPLQEYIFSYLAKLARENDSTFISFWYDRSLLNILLTHYSAEIPFEDYLKVLNLIVKSVQKVGGVDTTTGVKKTDLLLANFPHLLNML